MVEASKFIGFAGGVEKGPDDGELDARSTSTEPIDPAYGRPSMSSMSSPTFLSSSSASFGVSAPL
jgi:hypothetical protein